MQPRPLSQEIALRLLYPVAALVVSFFLLYPLLVPPGIPFQGDETYYIPWTIATVQRYNLQTWASGRGPSTDMLTIVPTLALTGLRFLVGQDFAVKGYLLSMAWLSGIIPYISTKALLTHWRLTRGKLHLEIASSVGGLVYLLFFSNQAIVAGSNNFVWNYAFFPILVSSLIIFLDTGKIRELLVFGISSILASPQPFWPFLVGIFGVSYIVFSLVQNRHLSKLVSLAKNSSIAVGVALVFNAFWIIPIFAGYLFSAGSNFQLYTTSRLISPADLDFLSFWNLTDVLLLGEGAHYFFWYHPQNYGLLSIVIPLLASAAIIAYRRSPQVTFLGATLLLGAFITSGSNEPFGFLYFPLASGLPYGAGAILRNPTKFVPIVTFSYALLLGLSIVPASYKIESAGRILVSRLRGRLSGSAWLHPLDSKTGTLRVLLARRFGPRLDGRRLVRPLIVLGLVLLVLTPIANGTILDLQGYTWQRYYPTTIPQRYDDLNSWLVGQPGDYKVMWVPTGGPYDWKPYDVSAFPDLYSAKPSVPFANIYPSPLNSTNHIGRMLSFLGVEYVIYHNDSIAYPGVPFLQELLAQKDLSIVQSYNDTFKPLDSSQKPFPTSTSEVQISNAPFQTPTSSLVRGRVSNLTMQYTVPQNLVNQGFHGQFWDGFGILIQGFPSGSVDVASRIFFATVASQTLMGDTTGSALFSAIAVPGNYPESTIDLYANFYDGSYRQLTPLFLVARLSLTPDRMTNQFLVFKNNDFGGSVFTQNPGVGLNQTVTDLLAGNTTVLSSSAASVTNVNQVGNVEFDVTVYATAPFVLVLAEPYDRLWSAYLSSGQLGSVPIYQLSNGFVISQTGTLTIRLYYGLQGYFTIGGWLSIGGLAGALVVSILLSRRKRARLVQSSKTVSLVQVPVSADVGDPVESSGD